jgi:hypothetical protein
MVLASLGDMRDEASLSELLGSYEFGTPASRIQRLARLGYSVEYRTFMLDELAAVLSAGLYPIAFVDAGFLPWADFIGFHAVVVAAIYGNDIELFDPASSVAPQIFAIDGFLAAWQEFDNRAALIVRE